MCIMRIHTLFTPLPVSLAGRFGEANQPWPLRLVMPIGYCYNVLVDTHGTYTPTGYTFLTGIAANGNQFEAIIVGDIWQ